MNKLAKKILNYFPEEFSICRTILKLFYIRCQILFIRNRYLYSIKDLEIIISKKKKKRMYLFGSGPSIHELNQTYYNEASKGISFATGRWYTHSFVPDILYLEFDSTIRKYKWLEIFANDLNNKKSLYLNSLILINIPIKDLNKLSKEFLNKIDSTLRKQIRFVTVLTASECKNYFYYVLNNSLINFLIKRWPILLHCRSSISCGLTISRILGLKDIYIAGVDGYPGYFLKYKSNWGRLEDKDTIEELHSTANPKRGIPTIDNCFASCDQIFNIKVSSKKTRLYEELMSRRKLNQQ